MLDLLDPVANRWIHCDGYNKVMRKGNAVSVFIMVVYLLAVAIHPQEVTADEARAIKRGVSYLKQAGLKWMDGRGCVSCHQVPTMIWSHEAALGKDDPQRTELNQWIDWSGKVMNLVKPHQKAEEPVSDLAIFLSF